jgi:hypothetical protein
MEDPAAVAVVDFEAALARIGFGPQERTAIIDMSGCRNIAMLGLLTADQVSKICKRIETRVIDPLPITTIQEQLLLAMRFWVANRQRLQLPIDAAAFTMIAALNQAQIMRQQGEDDARTDKEAIAKAPEKFKTANTWKVFAEATETYLGQLIGSGRIPLRYVIRRLVTPEPGTMFQTEQEQAIALAPLTGIAYQRDNAKVYGIIKQLLLEGPGWSYILQYDATSDGRLAWISLRNHFEGEGFRNRNVEDAYTTLEHLNYEGEKKGFSFEKFLERHMECYLESARYNEPVLESKKVRDFLSRIKAPELQAAKQQVKATANLSNSFQDAANFIALSVTPLKQAQRLIATLETQRGAAGNQFGRQRSIGAITSGPRHTVNRHDSHRMMASIQTNEEKDVVASLELDSHADTSCAGSNCRVITVTEKTCEVAPYHPEYPSMPNVL